MKALIQVNEACMTPEFGSTVPRNVFDSGDLHVEGPGK
jgi:hypothetical protein